MKNALRSKTIWFGVLVALVPFLGEVSGVLAEGGAPDWLVSVIGVLIVVLRFVTTEAVTLFSSKEDSSGGS